MIDLDGTDNKSNLGANAILSVSLATAVAAAKVSDMELFDYLYKLYRENQNLEPDYYLPTPMCNVLNGGVHAGNNLSVQEFMLVPIGADSYINAIVMVSEVYQYLKKKIRSKYGKTAINLGDEGGFAPNLNYTHEALDLLMDAIDESGYIKNKEISIALDSAASEFFENGKYKIDGKYLIAEELVDYYVELVNNYPIISIEDPFDENDFNSHSLLLQKIGSRVQIVGDDLFVTHIKRIKKGIKEKNANALLLKVNQVGSLTESFEAARICQENGLNVIVSHRSGETEDTFIADLSVGLSFNKVMIKSGAPARSERTAKYNRLIRIAEKISSKSSYSGKKF
jgi:enolase